MICTLSKEILIMICFKCINICQHFLFQKFELFFVMKKTNILFILYQFKFVDPLLRSPIVGDVAYETLIKLSRCLAPPLCHWAIDIATALRLIAIDEVRVQLDLIPLAGEGEDNERPSLGLFERIVAGLSVSCKYGPLPVDSFTFIFPVKFSLAFYTSSTA